MGFLRKTNKDRPSRAAAGAEQAESPAAPSEARLGELNKLLDKSDDLSETATINLQDLKTGLASLDVESAGDNLEEVGELVKKSKKSSTQARTNLQTVTENIESIRREARSRQQSS
jgi:hypothetical protein